MYFGKRLEPEDLFLEITESAYTDNAEQIIDIVTQLRSRGFFIEMDVSKMSLKKDSMI